MAEVAVEGGKRGRKAAIKAHKEENAQPETKSRGKAAKSPEGGPTFWQKVAAVARADWGPRANIYLYRVEPVIDRRRQGSQTYITKYAEPISEDRILADHGSGRYKLMLNFRKPGAEQGDEVDSLYLDLLNLQFPPKIPPGEWVDDPNNKKWAWAKQSFTPGNGTQQQSAADTVLDAIEIVDKLKGPHQDPVKTTLDTIKGVRDLMGSPQQASNPTEDLQNLVAVAEKLRPAETVPQFVQLQFAALQAEIAAARKRSDELMMMLIDRKPNGSDGSGLNLVKEVVSGLKELVPSIKEIVPGLDGVAGGRSRMGGWQEFAIGLAEHVGPLVSPFSGALAQVMLMKLAGPGQNPAMQPQPTYQPQALPAGQQANPGPATMMPFLQVIAMPMMNYVRPIGPPHNQDPEEWGANFGSWVFDGFGPHPTYKQAMAAAHAMGPIGIIAAFRSTPLWMDKGPQNNLPSLQELEPRLMPFFQAFLNWKPEEDTPDSEDEPEETDPTAPQVLNFDEKYAGAEA